MSINFVLPHVEYEVLSVPLNYFSHLFGHEGENSLLSYLISEGLALELTASGDHEMHAYSSFTIDITLTKKGLTEQERVVEAVFQYAQTLRERGPQEYVFEECRDLGRMQFEFADKGQALQQCI